MIYIAANNTVCDVCGAEIKGGQEFVKLGADQTAAGIGCGCAHPAGQCSDPKCCDYLCTPVASNA